MVLGIGGVAVPQAIAAPGAAASDADPAPQPETDRAKVLRLWQFGGPVTKLDASLALTGTDADVTRFLTTQFDLDSSMDLNLRVNQLMSAGGPSSRSAAQQALDANTDAALETYLDTGWQTPHGMDLNLQVNQAMSAGGPQLKRAAQQALDANSEAALRTFLTSGWQIPFQIDQNLKVNKVMSAGGPEVKRAAQQALDANTVDALNQFLAIDLPVAQARDAEIDSLTQLTATAKAASEQAANETAEAKRQADIAVTEAAAAQKAAQAAKDAAAAAQGHVEQATNAASRAAYAADQAAITARQAVNAANAASAAAHTAAVAASRAASAAAQAGRAASRAYDAAALAIGDAGKAGDARQAAQVAHDAALSAATARDAAQSARTASQQATTAGQLAGDAAAQSRTAADAAAEAADRSAAAGADARQAKAAAATARAQAARATAAANASREWAQQASQAASQAADAADAAANDALRAEAAALDAAAHAGHASDAAAQATAHANAATSAANAAVTASTQAAQIAQDARKADDDRIASAGQEQDDAAKAALADFAARTVPPRWDLDEAAKWDAETVRLITEANTAGTAPATVVQDARKVALKLADTGSSWTKAAALAALGATDDEAVTFVKSGLTAAAGQDNRVVLSTLAESATAGFRTAAAAAAAGSDTDVLNFLRSRDYTGRQDDDSLQVNQIMSAARTAGRTVVVRDAQRALDANSGQALRAFIDTGQYTALATDEDIAVNQVMSAARAAGSRELMASAQAAIDGPPTLRHEFLTVGQHTAARRDQNTAAHNAAVDGLVAQAAAAASSATHDADEAQAAAARARNAADDANRYASEADAAAKQAGVYADQARAAADRAANSAQQARTSANTAAAAARSATASADAADRSASRAQRSANDAANYAFQAANSASRAYDAARRAGMSAQEAAELAKGAWDSVATKAQNEKQNVINQRTWDCNYRNAWVAQSYSAEDCIKLFSGTPEEQQRIYQHLQDLCRQLNEPGTTDLANCLDAKNLLSPDYLPGPPPTGTSALSEGLSGLVLAGLLALMCPECELGSLLKNAESELGLVSSREISEAMARALAKGEGMLDVAGAEAVIELQNLRNLEFQTGTELSRLQRDAEAAARPPCLNSFAAGTEVLMADGSRKPIELVRAGDLVGNAEPDGTATQQHPVTAVHVTDDDKDFDELTVGTSSITTTAHHLVWDAGHHAWTGAAGLAAGDQLQALGDARVAVAANRQYSGSGRTYNLTVDRLHTYYVFAGDTPVLVHNDVCGAKTGAIPMTRKPIYGDYPDFGQTSLYVIVDPAAGKILKFGITNDPAGRYTVAEYTNWARNYGGRYQMSILRNFDTRDDALTIERYLSERVGGPENYEDWARSVPNSLPWDQVLNQGISAWQAGKIGPNGPIG
ncbi:polymorphic toxin-type HINT domain-containing protein [Amycolatopsis sp. OK19-0408]|uniref:Polymorphic toxin-type HINT domain-containing protein n=1 Tax=Amycolatopsis iheyensis TaxID=2945988 RepID=A0A9X2NH80_9PSEU|nr:polymorphic toxin-type HINT domain-containing protein [Amycolatopsis iheyensis]MCR6487218.1 polymorphic toxin-type HINT domain-containing protein [Amycolatopsis iheyensis]